jgi:hypothetical protein
MQAERTGALPGEPVMLSGRIASLPRMEVWEGVSFCQFTVAYGPSMKWGQPRDGESKAEGFVSCQCLGELAANMTNTRIGEQVVILGRFNPRAGIPTPLDALIDVFDLGISLLGSGVDIRSEDQP